MQDWYLEKRKEVEKIFAQASQVEKTEINESPSRKYSLEIIPYDNGPNSWAYSQGILKNIQTGSLIADVKRNYGRFPFSWSEGHPTGHDYLVCGEDYQGQTIIELDTGKRVDNTEDGFGFCWAAHYPSNDGKYIFVDGCIWAGPYELILFDFSNPMEFPYREIKRWPVEEVQGFLPDGSFIFDYNAEVRISDGKRLDEMAEEELDMFESTEGYEKMCRDIKIRVKWNPDGTEKASIIDRCQ